MRSSAFTQRISVLLPEPDGPHTTTTSPGATDRVMSRSTCSLPNHLLTPLKTIAAGGPEMAPRPPTPGSSIDHHQHVSWIHRLARRHAHLADRPAHRGLDLVLHFHRLDHDDCVPGLHAV